MPDKLRAALEEANLPTLLLVLAQLTANDRWLHEPYRPTPTRGLGDHDSAGLEPDIQAEIRRIPPARRVPLSPWRIRPAALTGKSDAHASHTCVWRRAAGVTPGGPLRDPTS